MISNPQLPSIALFAGAVACICFTVRSVRADLPMPVVTQQGAAEKAKMDAELDAISADFVAKFNANAPAEAFNPLLDRIAILRGAAAESREEMMQAYAALQGGGGGLGGSRILTLRQFIALWQDFLLHKELNPEAANNALQQLSVLATSLPLGNVFKPSK